jgi:hypothetical protein
MAQLLPYHLSDTYSYSQVSGIDHTGILFDDGTSILFQECAQNFARSYPESRGRCIAERRFPYFEFYTCGKSMVILFDRLGRDTMREFQDFSRRLTGYGYSTYDLT